MQKIKSEIDSVLCKDLITIHQLAKLVGQIVATFRGNQYGKLFYRSCDNFKNENCHLRVLSDNTTAVAYLNIMGERS